MLKLTLMEMIALLQKLSLTQLQTAINPWRLIRLAQEHKLYMIVPKAATQA